MAPGSTSAWPSSAARPGPRPRPRSGRRCAAIRPWPLAGRSSPACTRRPDARPRRWSAIARPCIWSLATYAACPMRCCCAGTWPTGARTMARSRRSWLRPGARRRAVMRRRCCCWHCPRPMRWCRRQRPPPSPTRNGVRCWPGRPWPPPPRRCPAGACGSATCHRISAPMRSPSWCWRRSRPMTGMRAKWCCMPATRARAMHGATGHGPWRTGSWSWRWMTTRPRNRSPPTGSTCWST